MSYHLDWAINELNERGFQVPPATPDIVQNNPWATVYRISTDKGFTFLKKVPPALAIEPKIIKVLHENFHAPVPEIIAINQDLHCFLMKDAGIQLHHYFKESFKPEILIKIMHEYTLLQISSMEKINSFLNLGLPDYRLERLPYLYQDLISQEKILIEDGLNKDELFILKNLESTLFSFCEKLSHYKIKDTFGHADFHDKNILIDPSTNKTIIIDLGEVAITHPIFSFLNCLHMAQENFSLSTSQYQQLKLECFKPWLAFESYERLFEILDIIQKCWSIHAVLGEFRVINSVNPSDHEKLRKDGRIANKLRHFISANKI